jgi:membrane protease YdiL (CAAX protease family)
MHPRMALHLLSAQSQVAVPAAVPDPVAPASPAADRPRVWTVFAAWALAAVVGQVAVLAVLVTAGVAIAVVVLVQGAGAAEIQPRAQAIFGQPLPALLMTLVPFQLGMGLIVLLAARQSPISFRERVGLVPQTGRKFGLLRLASLAAFTLSAALATAIGFSLLAGEPAAAVLNEGVDDTSWWSLVLISIILSLLPAILEEIVFRGYIQRRLLQRWSPAAAIGISTLLFALLHFDSLQHILAVVPLGLITGLVAWRTNSARPGMLVHAIHNAGAVGFVTLVRVLTPLLGEEGLGQAILGGLVVMFLLGLPAVLSLLWPPRSQPVELPAALSLSVPALASPSV